MRQLQDPWLDKYQQLLASRKKTVFWVKLAIEVGATLALAATGAGLVGSATRVAMRFVTASTRLIRGVSFAANVVAFTAVSTGMERVFHPDKEVTWQSVGKDF